MALAVTESASGVGVPSFEELYRTYSPRVRSMLQSRFRRDSAKVDDLVQDVFLRAYRAYPALLPGADPWPWLCTITLNLSIDEHRRPKREVAVELEDRQASYGDPWEHYAAHEKGDALRAAFDTLPDRGRRLVLLKDAAGYDYDDLAEAEGTTVQALRNAVSRARRHLRDSYTVELTRRGLAAILAPILPKAVLFQARARRATELGSYASATSSSGVAAALVIGMAGLIPLADALPTLHSTPHATSTSHRTTVTLPGTVAIVSSHDVAEDTPVRPAAATPSPTATGRVGVIPDLGENNVATPGDADRVHYDVFTTVTPYIGAMAGNPDVTGGIGKPTP
jgi:RNA polymerase sigma-70 factor (ECF subfamily)